MFNSTRRKAKRLAKGNIDRASRDTMLVRFREAVSEAERQNEITMPREFKSQLDRASRNPSEMVPLKLLLRKQNLTGPHVSTLVEAIGQVPVVRKLDVRDNEIAAKDVHKLLQLLHQQVRMAFQPPTARDAGGDTNDVVWCVQSISAKGAWIHESDDMLLELKHLEPIMEHANAKCQIRRAFLKASGGAGQLAVADLQNAVQEATSMNAKTAELQHMIREHCDDDHMDFTAFDKAMVSFLQSKQALPYLGALESQTIQRVLQEEDILGDTPVGRSKPINLSVVSSSLTPERVRKPTQRGSTPEQFLEEKHNMRGDDNAADHEMASLMESLSATKKPLPWQTMDQIRQRWFQVRDEPEGQNFLGFIYRAEEHTGSAIDETDVKQLFRKILRFSREEISDGDILNFFQELDTDGSGSISAEEFFAVLGPSIQATRPPPPPDELSMIPAAQNETVANLSLSDDAPEPPQDIRTNEIDHHDDRSFSESTPSPSPRRPGHRVKAELPSEGTLEMIRDRWKGASYTSSGQNWLKLFRSVDSDHNGTLEEHELRSMFRRVLHLTTKDITDEQIAALFAFIDKDNSQDVSIKELFAFIGEPPHTFKEMQQSSTPKSARKATPDDEKLALLRQRWFFSSNSQAGQNWLQVFRSGDQTIDVHEFRSMIRRVLQLQESQISDEQIAAAFAYIDTDNSRSLTLTELFAFIGAPPLQQQNGSKPHAQPQTQVQPPAPGISCQPQKQSPPQPQFQSQVQPQTQPPPQPQPQSQIQQAHSPNPLESAKATRMTPDGRGHMGLDLSHAELTVFSITLLRPPHLELASINRIRTLNLSHNQLQTLEPESLGSLVALAHLDVSHNFLTRLEPRGGAEAFPDTLQTLDCSHNKIARIGSLHGCTKLRHLNLSHNNLRSAMGLEHLDALEELDLRACAISGTMSIRTLSCNRGLRVLLLDGNTITQSAGYRASITCLLPHLLCLDEKNLRPAVKPQSSSFEKKSTKSSSPRSLTSALPKTEQSKLDEERYKRYEAIMERKEKLRKQDEEAKRRATTKTVPTVKRHPAEQSSRMKELSAPSSRGKTEKSHKSRRMGQPQTLVFGRPLDVDPIKKPSLPTSALPLPRPQRRLSTRDIRNESPADDGSGTASERTKSPRNASASQPPRLAAGQSTSVRRGSYFGLYPSNKSTASADKVVEVKQAVAAKPKSPSTQSTSIRRGSYFGLYASQKSSTGTTESNVWEEIFSELDKNQDGFLTQIEIISGIRSAFRNGKTAFLAKVHDALGLPEQIRQEDGTRDVFQRIFHKIDVDDDKKISVDELKQYMTQYSETDFSRLQGEAGAIEHFQSLAEDLNSESEVAALTIQNLVSVHERQDVTDEDERREATAEIIASIRTTLQDSNTLASSPAAMSPSPDSLESAQARQAAQEAQVAFRKNNRIKAALGHLLDLMETCSPDDPKLINYIEDLRLHWAIEYPMKQSQESKNPSFQRRLDLAAEEERPTLAPKAHEIEVEEDDVNSDDADINSDDGEEEAEGTKQEISLASSAAEISSFRDRVRLNLQAKKASEKPEDDDDDDNEQPEDGDEEDEEGEEEELVETKNYQINGEQEEDMEEDESEEESEEHEVAWVRGYDPNHKTYYYFNQVTGQSQWTEPNEPWQDADSDDDDDDDDDDDEEEEDDDDEEEDDEGH